MKEIMIEGILSIQAGENPHRRGKAQIVLPSQLLCFSTGRAPEVEGVTVRA